MASNTSRVAIDTGTAIIERRVTSGGDGCTQPDLARRIAAVANNLVVTWGAQRLHISSPDQHLAVAAYDTLLSRYAQVTRFVGTSASDPLRCITASTQPPAWHGGAAAAQSLGVLQPSRPRGWAIGINVGQTNTKALIAGPGGADITRATTMPTFSPKDESHGQGVPERVVELCERLLAAPGESIAAIGLCTGGIVEDGRILPDSGVTLGMGRRAYEAFASLGQRLSRQLGLPVTISQDAQAKAFFHAVDDRLRSAMVLDVGTSLGGAFIDDHGAIPARLNQVGRMAFDLSDAAVDRVDHEGKGLLSQYLSATGIARTARSMGLSVDGGLGLYNLLSSGPARVRRPLLSQLRATCLRAVDLIADYYPLRSVMFTGGLLSETVAEEIRSWVHALPDGQMVNLCVSNQPMYDACTGVAWAAQASTTSRTD